MRRWNKNCPNPGKTAREYIGEKLIAHNRRSRALQFQQPEGPPHAMRQRLERFGDERDTKNPRKSLDAGDFAIGQ